MTDEGLGFDTLQQRLHPAASRVRKLAEETPASFVAFDLLALDDRDLSGEPFAERRRILESVLGGDLGRVHLTPMTDDPDVAEDWFTRFEGAGFDGVMAKPADQPYQQDKRVMWKVKHERTADCVVAGFRVAQGRGGGRLAAARACSTTTARCTTSVWPAASRPLVVASSSRSWRSSATGALDEHPWRDWATAAAEAKEAGRMPGGVSRWNAQKDLSWEPLRPELVAEVRYEHVLGGRFRHGGRLVRFRLDRTPDSCTYAQLDEVAPAELADIFNLPG